MSFRRYIAVLGILLIMAPSVAVFSVPQEAEAQSFTCGALFGLGAGASALLGSLGTYVPVNDAAVTTNTGAAVQKECVDELAYLLANAAIESIARSVINWINSGFDGSPAFVTDLDAFLGGVGVEAFEDYIGSDAIAFLCSPWRFDVELALQAEFFGTTDVPACSLLDVVENIDGFLAGDFSQGGWDGWYHLSTRNNPYSDYFTAESELYANVAAFQNVELELLDYGSGFRSFEHCTTREANPSDPNAQPGDIIEECEITTPGNVIENQVNNVLGSGQDRLEMADEINEILAAFIQQLINQVITEGLGSF